MKTTLGIEFEPFFPQISHRAKIGCAKYDLSTGEAPLYPDESISIPRHP